jgi:hypothetical protein
MEPMSRLPRMARPSAGPKSTACEAQKWVDVSPDEALTTKERLLRNDRSGQFEAFRWVTISIDESLRTGLRGRCVECKEPVRPHHGSIDGMAPHFEHLKRNPKFA